MKTLILRALFIFLAFTRAAHADEARDPDRYFFDPPQSDIKQELALARRAGKQALFVFYESKQCGYCREMRAEVLSDPEVQKIYRTHFRSIALDVQSQRPLKGFNGMPYTESEFAAEVAGIEGTPALVFYALDGEELGRRSSAMDQEGFLDLAARAQQRVKRAAEKQPAAEKSAP